MSMTIQTALAFLASQGFEVTLTLSPTASLAPAPTVQAPTVQAPTVQDLRAPTPDAPHGWIVKGGKRIRPRKAAGRPKGSKNAAPKAAPSPAPKAAPKAAPARVPALAPVANMFGACPMPGAAPAPSVSTAQVQPAQSEADAVAAALL